MALLDKIELLKQNLRPSEKKVADYILLRPNEVIHMRIVDLASEAKVSEPTVVRFCRAMSLDGFQALKLKLAQELAVAQAEPANFTFDSTTSSYIRNIFDSTFNGLHQARQQIHIKDLEQAITLLENAKRIEIMGVGASARVAEDAQDKFMKLHIHAVASSEPHIQRLSIQSLTDIDAIIALSQSGNNKDLLKSVMLANQGGIKVISLCPGDSDLAKASTLCISINIRDRLELYGSLSTRIVHLVLMDILAVGVAIKRTQRSR